MLNKISCSLFNHAEITFSHGLNVILGDDDAKNSIGKSSALMVIDFAMGGNSLLEDKAGVINSMGHHFYKLEFNFNNISYFFSRYTDDSGFINVCNENYDFVNRIKIDEYTDKLKSLYSLNNIKSSFRTIVGPFSRIWNKGALDPEHPFSGFVKETAGSAIDRLIDLFERSADISEEKSILDKHNERKKLISKSMSEEIIPNINKTKYKENLKLISDNSDVIDKLKQGFTGALDAYEALFDEDLRKLQHTKNELFNQKNQVQIKIERIKLDLSGVTPRLAANISLVKEFFPDVNATRLQQVELFHHNISKLVQKELKKDLASHCKVESDLSDRIGEIDNAIRISLASKGTPDDLFARVFDLKEVTDKAALENGYYDTKVIIDEEFRLSKERLSTVYMRIFLDIEKALNSKLKNFNKVVYGPNRNASQIRIKNANSYVFISPEDTGTGKSYAGLVGFDLAMLSLTYLPYIIHDSVIYKNIEVPATRNILRILAAVKRKQVFLAFDEAAKFGIVAEKILRSHTILKLSDNDLLYKKDWREQ